MCLVDSDCPPPWEMCLSTICMRSCTPPVLCQSKEYCNHTVGACIPKNIRRKFTDHCGRHSHCYLNEICSNRRCEVSNNMKFPCEFQRHCMKPGTECIDGYCEVAKCTENSDCLLNEVCVNSKCVDKPICTVDTQCMPGLERCKAGRCTESYAKCLTTNDCSGNELCHERLCKRRCDHRNKCPEEENCVNNLCESIHSIIMMQTCKNGLHCPEGNMCIKNKCVFDKKKVNQKVLPKNFLCKCKENENCDTKDCVNENKPITNQGITKPAIVVETVPTNIVTTPTVVTQSKSLTDIIKEMLQEETKNLVLEIDHRQKTMEDKFKLYQTLNNEGRKNHHQEEETKQLNEEEQIKGDTFGQEDGNFLSGPVSLEEESPDQLQNSRDPTDERNKMKKEIVVKEDDENEDENENCFTTTDCPAVRGCCILGVCVNTTNCFSDLKREIHEVQELRDIGNNCSKAEHCEDGNICHFGFCKTFDMIRSAREEEEVECVTDTDCEMVNHGCILNMCVEVLIINETLVQPCNENCTDVCWMNACIEV